MTIQSVGILGSGVMGSGIAQMFAENRIQVLLWDVEPQFTEKGIRSIRKRLDKSVEKGKIDITRVEEIMGYIKPVDKLASMASAGLIIEAVIEDVDVKCDLYRQLEAVIPAATLVGTNTSSLSVRSLSECWQNPARFAGVHFFNPPTKLELVELIMTDSTSAETEPAINELLTSCGKTLVQVKDSPGFIVNRLLLPMINEAAKLVDAGVADVAAIDTAMKLGALHPVGPLELADLIGLDVCRRILDEMAIALDNPFYGPAQSLVDRVDAGKLGRKTKCGFYEY